MANFQTGYTVCMQVYRSRKMRPALVCSKCNDPDFLNQCCGSKYLSYFHPSGYTPMNIIISNITLILCVPANTKIGLYH